MCTVLSRICVGAIPLHFPCDFSTIKLTETNTRKVNQNVSVMICTRYSSTRFLSGRDAYFFGPLLKRLNFEISSKFFQLERRALIRLNLILYIFFFFRKVLFEFWKHGEKITRHRIRTGMRWTRNEMLWWNSIKIESVTFRPPFLCVVSTSQCALYTEWFSFFFSYIPYGSI